MYKTHVLIPNEKRKFIYSEAPEKQPPTMPLKQAVNTTVKKEKDTKKSKCFGLFSSGDKNTCSPWLWLLIIPIIFVLILVFVGPWYHGCKDKDNCTNYRNYGIYCDRYCVYGHYGPGTASAGILIFFSFFLIIFCFFGAFGGDCYNDPYYYSPYYYGYPYYDRYYYRRLPYYSDRIPNEKHKP